MFSVLDMSQTYNQIPIAKDSQVSLTINTHVGMFAFERLPFGVHSAPACFSINSRFDLGRCSQGHLLLDDIFVGGVDEKDHL